MTRVRKNLQCTVCGLEAVFHFEQKVMGRHTAQYFHCPHCSCIFVPQPHWLPEAYEQALNVFDTGAVSRNLWLARITAAILYMHCGPRQQYLDYAAGYGLFVRLMRDVGFDYFWADPHASNLFARGFEHQQGTRYAAVTAFEVLEHLTDPVVDMGRLAEITDTVIVSTELWSDQPPTATEWWYYGFEHGQHVMFYSRRTLEVLAARHGYRLISDGRSLHVFTRRPDPEGVLCQIITKGRASRKALRRAVRGPDALRLPPYWLTGPRLSVTKIEQAVRRQMSPKTMPDHELLRARFAEELHADRRC